MRRWQLGSLQLDPDLSSGNNFSIARDWLGSCQSNHIKCGLGTDTPLPTRVIDVGSNDPEFVPRLVSTTDTMGKYAALSHCWGGNIDFQTTTETIDHMFQGMSLTKMPVNFRDAITITQNLGLRYLWIDSICIIQNSRDWEIEASKMADIYANATVTIAAAVAHNSTYGILRHSTPETPLFRINFDDEATPDDELLVFPTSQKTRRQAKEEHFEECVQDGVLASRGWTLQERLLSRRILHYGRNEIFWSCQEAIWSGSGIGADPSIQLFLKNNISDAQISEDGFKSCRYAEWYETLSHYTASRELTKRSDKLPALSGIASSIQKLTGDSYMAGLWRSELLLGLLWQIDSVESIKRANPARGPSWSWVNFDGSIHFLGHLSERIRYKELAKIEDITVDVVSDANPFGEVSGGRLTLTTKLLELDFSLRGALRRTKLFLRSVMDYDDISEESGIWGKRPVLILIANTLEKVPEPIISLMPSFFGPPPPRPDKDMIQALILREVDGSPNVFQRIGQVSLDEMDNTIGEGETEVDIAYKMETITII